MSELRQNIVTKEWVIIASDRAKRPDDYADNRKPAITETRAFYDANCPFCPDNEELELEVYRRPIKGPWQIRVVDNRYPALSKEGGLVRSFDGLHRQISGVGHHEVVVDSSRHNTTMALMSAKEIQNVLETFYERGWSLTGDNRIEQIVYFKNHRQAAGASLKHPHSQIIALPVVPTRIRQRIGEARRYFDDYGQCVLCTLLKNELKNKIRIVSSNEDFVAFNLYASNVPFHTWIVPREHSISYLFSRPEQIKTLSMILRDVLRRLYIGLQDPAYNLIIRTAPVRELGNGYIHWYLNLLPRLSQAAGFELGSGMYINPSLPEECADFLRRVKI